MRPDTEAEESDRHRCDGHKGVAEDRFAGENRNDLGDHSETGQDQNIYLGVAEKPERVLPEQGLAAGRRVEEESVQVPVHEQHHQRGVQRRQGQEHENGVDRRHPDEQRDPGQFHVGARRSATVTRMLIAVIIVPAPVRRRPTIQ